MTVVLALLAFAALFVLFVALPRHLVDRERRKMIGELTEDEDGGTAEISEGVQPWRLPEWEAGHPAE